jgi:hypothetical protein
MCIADFPVETSVFDVVSQVRHRVPR